MKSKLTKLLIALVCVTLCLAALCAVALADGEACTHEYARVERPHDYYDATCIAPGGYTVTVTCENCGAFINEYKQSDPNKPINQNAHSFKNVTAEGECGTYTQQICTLCGYTTQDTNAATHDWQSKSYTATSCKEESYTYDECSKCHLQRNYKTTPRTVTHTYNTQPRTLVRASTCSVPGEEQQKCDCGEKTRTIPVATTPHSYNAAVTTQGNCTTKTKTSQTCKVCNYENVISYGDYVHNYVTIVTKEADCTNAGTRVSRCSNCQKEEWSVPIPALGHSTYWNCDASGHWKECSRCHTKTTDVQSHNPTRANDYCTTQAACSTCGFVVTPAKKHAASVVNDSGDDTYHDLKCANCSYVSSRVKHTYTALNGNCVGGRVCTVCNHRASGNSSHSLSSTWTSAGASQHSRKCTFSGCTYAQTEDHIWSDWTITKEPTTTSVGTESRSCTKCSSSMVRAIPKLTATDTPNTSATSTPSSAATPTPAPTSASTSGNNDSAPSGTQAPAATDASANAGSNTNTGSSASTGRATATPAATNSSSASAATAAPNAGSTSASTSASATAAPTNAATNAAPEAPAADTATEAVTAPTTDAPEGVPADVAAPEAHNPEALPQTAPTDTPCATVGTECTETEFIQGGLLVRVCAVCGNVTVEPLFDDDDGDAPVFANVAGVTVIGATQAGQLVLLGANLYNEAAGATDAFLALTASWEQDGQALPFETPVQVSLPLTIGDAADDGALSVPTAEFKLVRIDVDEDEGFVQMQSEIEYAYADGVLTFEMDRVAVYLLIPA